jgi:hypothetical protein
MLLIALPFYSSQAQCSGANEKKRITIFFRAKADIATATASVKFCTSQLKLGLSQNSNWLSLI